MIENLIKIFLPTTLAFIVGISITPLISFYLYKYKLWKKKPGKILSDGSTAEVFNSLHLQKETGTPRMGGTIIWISVCVVTIILWLLGTYVDGVFSKLDFVSRDQTWIPLLTLVFGAFIGLIDDILEVRGMGGGLSLAKRLVLVGGMGLFCGYWFYEKLGISSIGLPFGQSFFIGWLIIPLFAIVMIAIYSGGIIDGIDGLSGGIFASIFTAYAALAFAQHQINLAAFSATIVGAILAFLWFNIPPARFYMTETGSMALTITLAVIVFMTDALSEKSGALASGGYGLLVFPIIAFPLVATSASNIIQKTSKKLFGKKVFRIAPLHHHFEALGWPSYKVTMRYWIIGVVAALLGMILGLVG